MRREIPPRILKLQQQQKQPLPPRILKQQKQLPPRMRRDLPPRLCKLQEQQLAQAAPQAQQNMFLQHLSQSIKIQRHMLRTQQASLEKLLIMRQQQEQRHRHFQQSALKEQHPELQQNKSKSNEDYSRLLSFLGSEPAELTILMRQKASIMMRQRQLQEEAVGFQLRCAQQLGLQQQQQQKQLGFQKAIMRTQVQRENIEYKRLTLEEQIKRMGLEPGSFFSYSLPSNYVNRSPNS
ncbi:hypothetical protein JRO89_XS05G0034000 [Xanthoceras sorbifolium]|uniref:Uncharacterized protein n=1 Tax=Xanthoceras sorbifolium TaxID=99658 RepID=A0ABQ8I085_9ROSI|nr:hypothetical protein JRO89_XS05G0034000 [Xanthoceras sorbifolium]